MAYINAREGSTTLVFKVDAVDRARLVGLQEKLRRSSMSATFREAVEMLDLVVAVQERGGTVQLCEPGRPPLELPRLVPLGPGFLNGSASVMLPPHAAPAAQPPGAPNAP